ncbi:NAD(+) diphosphatase [Plantactinospora endophytica]|uniref:NAD(+) diphosphatase n=1 Tax=Plantactinospora endophytica TaxID=673535 RepID=A0ABQ4DTU1_9ACTN|nr:NAD(+) diphosphatase [Plantactinospora endophytica]GIG85863.1 putative NADH pyrophosphatase/NUDIX hydrolase [Plantactinospora endophytica]
MTEARPPLDRSAGHPPLARSTLDRAAHRRADQRWLADAWQRSRVLVVDVANGGRTLVGAVGDKPELILLGPDAARDSEPAARLFLGVEPDGVAVFAVDAPLPEIAGTRPANLREVGHLLGDRDAGLFTTAVALANWHARHLYSSLTGLSTVVGDAGWSRRDEAGNQLWPRTDPAMIVLVHDDVAGPDGRCLLGNNAAWRGERGVRRYSCLAGYVEPGESAEDAVVREVTEEVGLVPHHIGYVASQSWPFPGSLMLGFFARADPARPVKLDPAEIAYAGWFSRRQIASVLAGAAVEVEDGVRLALPPPSSIALFLIRRWLDGAA